MNSRRSLPTDHSVPRVADLVSPGLVASVAVKSMQALINVEPLPFSGRSNLLSGLLACAFFSFFLSFLVCSHSFLNSTKNQKQIVRRHPPPPTPENTSRVSRVQRVLCCQVGLRFQQPLSLTPAHNANPKQSFFLFFSFILFPLFISLSA